MGSGVKSIADEAFWGCNGLATVNYTGGENDWEKITIGSSNSALTRVTINYNYKAK